MIRLGQIQEFSRGQGKMMEGPCGVKEQSPEVLGAKVPGN